MLSDLIMLGVIVFIGLFIMWGVMMIREDITKRKWHKRYNTDPEFRNAVECWRTRSGYYGWH